MRRGVPVPLPLVMLLEERVLRAWEEARDQHPGHGHGGWQYKTCVQEPPEGGTGPCLNTRDRPSPWGGDIFKYRDSAIKAECQRGWDIPCLGTPESTNSGATKPVPFLKNERTNYAGLAKAANEKQWTAAVISGRTFLVHQPALLPAPH